MSRRQLCLPLTPSSQGLSLYSILYDIILYIFIISPGLSFFPHIGNARFISFVLLSTFRMLKAALLQAGTCGAAQLQRCSHRLSVFAPLSVPVIFDFKMSERLSLHPTTAAAAAIIPCSSKRSYSCLGLGDTWSGSPTELLNYHK